MDGRLVLAVVTIVLFVAGAGWVLYVSWVEFAETRRIERRQAALDELGRAAARARQ